jgi:hypothetical protein
MASPAQITANRANAKLSTGPRTGDGKTASSHNAARHGFTSMQLTVAAPDLADFEQFKTELLADVRPEGALEQSLFERLLIANWNLRRITRYELQLLDETNPFDPTSVDNAPCFDRLARYRRDLERSAQRTLAELRKLQTQRAVLLQMPGRVVEAVYNSTPLAELSAITGDTEFFIGTDAFLRPSEFHKDRAAGLEAARNPKPIDLSKARAALEAQGLPTSRSFFAPDSI